MKFRKQCPRCGYLDTSMTTMPIPNGCARPSFDCPKCKKSQQVEVQGVG
jgi:transcription elongation factor Elf1